MTPNQTYKRMTEQLIETIKSGNTGEWIKPWKCTKPKNFASGRQYSGINILFLWAEAERKNYPTNQWLTLNQVNKLGCKVKKGEKATAVFFFTPYEIQEKNEKGVMETKTIPLLKNYYVFNVTQTTIDVKVDDETSEKKTIAEIESFVKATGAVIENDGRAYYHMASDKIGIPRIENFFSADHYYSTLFHELAHWTRHPSRLNRKSGRFGSESYAFEELVAETASAFLNVETGIEWKNMQHAEYLESWLKVITDNPRILLSAANQAEKVVTYLKGLQNK